VGAAQPNEALLRFNLADAPVDLLITDVALPDLGGRELARRMRRAAGGLRVVFMSGHDEQGLLEDGRLEKSAPFLQKPFDRTTLAKTVQEAFDAQ
jgi:FixJ family two-component response regulator